MFRTFLSASAAALLLSTAGIAFASDMDTTGTIKSLDAAARHVALTNGMEFSVPETVHFEGVRPGDVVVINWSQTGQKRQALSISPAGGMAATGVVKAESVEGKTLTLENGVTYSLADGVTAGGLKPGDRVMVTWDKVGTTFQALSVSPLTHEDVTAAVKSVSVEGKTITLADGTSYTVADGVPLGGYKPGDLVTVIWDQNGGGGRQALDIMPTDDMGGKG
ncbi:DUF1344 domain-containing protein [Defluviimonas sp. SAOS-178_SWC]|uniref:DUF1344 domain-containing protein n=1 Tax=Defluviimonas sp. SAOS-178_SWC TaxID=3121287 RepID=UPI003221FC7D